MFKYKLVEEAIKNRDISTLNSINKSRNDLMEDLNGKGISTRPATHAVHMLSYYKNKYKINPEKYLVSFAASQCSISIPLFNGMTEDEQNYVIENIISYRR